MKKIVYFLVFFSFSTQLFTNPRETIVVVDMDNVFVSSFDSKAYIKSCLSCVHMAPSFVWQVLTKSHFRKKYKNIVARYTAKNKITPRGATEKLAALARLFKPLQTVFDDLMQMVHTNRTVIQESIQFLQTLKDQGYTLMVATNRDRMGFEIISKALQFDTLYHGKPLFDKVMVGLDNNFVERTTINGKRFSSFAPDSNLDGYIISTSSSKPEAAYYRVMRNVVDMYASVYTEKFDTLTPDIIFFDDRKENIKGALKSNLNISAYQVPLTKQGKSMANHVERHLAH